MGKSHYFSRTRFTNSRDGKRMGGKDEKVASIFRQADERLQMSLSQLIFEGPQDVLTKQKTLSQHCSRQASHFYKK